MTKPHQRWTLILSIANTSHTRETPNTSQTLQCLSHLKPITNTWGFKHQNTWDIEHHKHLSSETNHKSGRHQALEISNTWQTSGQQTHQRKHITNTWHTRHITNTWHIRHITNWHQTHHKHYVLTHPTHHKHLKRQTYHKHLAHQTSQRKQNYASNTPQTLQVTKTSPTRD